MKLKTKLINTTKTSALITQESENLFNEDNASAKIELHKISKTGDWNDLDKHLVSFKPLTELSNVDVYIRVYPGLTPYYYYEKAGTTSLYYSYLKSQLDPTHYIIDLDISIYDVSLFSLDAYCVFYVGKDASGNLALFSDIPTSNYASNKLKLVNAQGGSLLTNTNTTKLLVNTRIDNKLDDSTTPYFKLFIAVDDADTISGSRLCTHFRFVITD